MVVSCAMAFVENKILQRAKSIKDWTNMEWYGLTCWSHVLRVVNPSKSSHAAAGIKAPLIFPDFFLAALKLSKCLIKYSKFSL